MFFQVRGQPFLQFLFFLYINEKRKKKVGLFDVSFKKNQLIFGKDGNHLISPTGSYGGVEKDVTLKDQCPVFEGRHSSQLCDLEQVSCIYGTVSTWDKGDSVAYSQILCQSYF